MENSSNKYEPLFEIRLFYHLNKTSEDFYSLSENERKRWMYSYDCRHFFTIASAEENTFKKNRAVYKKTALGCMVLIPDTVLYEDDVKFEFIVKTENFDLLNYSGEITSFEYEDQKKNRRIRRYKKIFMFSNTIKEDGGIHFVSPVSPSVIKHDYFPEYKFLLSENILERKQFSPEEAFGNSQELLSSRVFPDDIFAFIRLTGIKNPHESVRIENAGRKYFHPIFEINFEKCGEKKTQSVIDKNVNSSSSFLQKMKNSLLS